MCLNLLVLKGMALKPVMDRDPVVQVHRDWSYPERVMGVRKSIAWRRVLCFYRQAIKPVTPMKNSTSNSPMDSISIRSKWPSKGDILLWLFILAILIFNKLATGEWLPR